MELTTCARPYARAAFEHARQAGQLPEWADMLALCARVTCQGNVQRLLNRPSLTCEQQADAFLSLCQGHLSRELENFIRILSENRRIPLLPQIEALFGQLKAEEERSQDVSITSAFPLTEAQLTVLENKVETRLGRRVKLNTRIDSDLIGGVIIKVGDLVIDGSLRARLAKLADAIIS